MKNKMRTLLIIILLVSSVYKVKAQTKFVLKGKPKTLNECFVYLDSKLDIKTIEILKNTQEDSLISFHFGFGMWLRNHLGLWKNSDLAKYFAGIGILHPDDMSHVIIVSYHRYLNKEDIKLKEQILRCQGFYKDLYYIPPVDSNIVKKNLNISLGIGLGWGHYGQLKDLNNTLNNSPFPPVKKTYNSIIFSLSEHKNRFYFNGDFVYNYNISTDTSNTFQSQFNSSFLKFDLEYDVYQSKKIAYLVFAGFGFGGCYLDLWSPIPDSVSWSNISNYSNHAEIVKSPISTLEWGIGIRSRSDKIFHWDLKLGYSLGIFEEEWNFNQIKFGENPKVNINGAYLKITGYLNYNVIVMRN